MSERKVPSNATEMLEALMDFVHGPVEDVQDVPIEKVMKDLEKEGLDPRPLVKMVRDRLATARAEQSLREARQERERIAELISHRSSPAYRAQDLKDRVLNILRSNPKLAPAYRKFEDATEEDLKSLLEDLELLNGLDDDTSE